MFVVLQMQSREVEEETHQSIPSSTPNLNLRKKRK